MNFAYLDARSLFETVMAPSVEPIETIPCVLDEKWKELETALSNFKLEYAKVRVDLATRLAELHQKKEEVNVLKMIIENVTSLDLKERIDKLLEQHENEQNLEGLTRECGELTGRSQAMKKVLQDTDAERYGQFTCFVCMDRLVDLFIDPCGHVICEPCWGRTQNKTNCPGCRTRIFGVKKMFSMN